MAAVLVSHWPFDNAYTDTNASTNDLVAEGTGNSFSTTIVKKGTHSLQLNGSGDAIKSSGATSWNTGNSDFSVGGWLDWTTTIGVGVLVGFGSGSNGQTIFLYSSDATTITLENLVTESQSWTVSSMSQSVWYWYWIEYTAGTKTAVLYLNNTAQGSKVFSSTFNVQAGKCSVGANFSTGGRVTGNIDDVYLYNGITTAAERAALFGNASGMSLNSKFW